MSLAARLARALSALPADRTAQREQLASCFAGPQYEGHREAIIAALCSAQPWYSFRETGKEGDDWATRYHTISWHGRDQGGAPFERLIVLHHESSDPPPEDDGI